MDEKTCGFLSHIPTRFKFGWDEEDPLCLDLKQVILQQIQRLRQKDYNSFYVVPDSGASLWTGELLNLLRQDDSSLLLQCILPHEEIATKWSPELRDRYFALLEQCTHLSAVSRPDDPDATKKALSRMIDYSDFVIAVYDPASRRGDAVDQAMDDLIKTRKQFLMIHPDTLELRPCLVYDEWPLDL